MGQIRFIDESVKDKSLTFTSKQCHISSFSAFNDTMLRIWQEQITLLGVIDTGALLASPKALPVRADGRFFEVRLSQSFLEIFD